MNVALALTAAKFGAAVANHLEVVELIKSDEEEPQVRGALVRDELTGRQFVVKAKVFLLFNFRVLLMLQDHFLTASYENQIRWLRKSLSLQQVFM